MPEEVARLVSASKQLKLSFSGDGSLLRQNIDAPYSFIRERLDCGNGWAFAEVSGEEGQTFALEFADSYMRTRPQHQHAYLELMLVLSGEVRNEVEKENFIYRAGQGCVMNYNIRHREIPVADMELLFIALRPEFLKELFSELPEGELPPDPSGLLSYLRDSGGDRDFSRHYWDFSSVVGQNGPELRLLEAAEDALRQKRPERDHLAKAAILGFLTALCDPERYHLQGTSSCLEHREFLVSKIDFLIRSAGGRIGSAELGEQLSYDSDYLNRIYRLSTGKSISDACKEAMVSEAKRLFRENGLTADETMERLGVTSRGFFFRTFRELTGITPAEYRRKYGQQAARSGGKKA